MFPQLSWPRIDLLLLGLGSDGHTASLFPHSDVLKERRRWVVSDISTQAELPRLTLTIPAINAARRIAFLVAGAEKAAIIHTILGADGSRSELPAEAIDPLDGELHWLLDKTAADKIIES
jgi:6-phosphogluconolactonase